jgi:hypothetical protein
MTRLVVPGWGTHQDEAGTYCLHRVLYAGILLDDFYGVHSIGFFEST